MQRSTRQGHRRLSRSGEASGRPQGHGGGGLAPEESVSGRGMRSAEVQGSRRNSYGATIPLMEEVRDVVGKVNTVTGTTSHLDLVNHAGEGLQILLGVTSAVYVCALKEKSVAVTLSGLYFQRAPLAAVWEWLELGRSLSLGARPSAGSPPTVPHLYRLRSVNQSWTTITTWQTVKRKAAIWSD